MKQFIISALTICATTAAVYAQDVNKTNTQGQREGVWIGYYPNTNNIRYEGTFNKGKETGTFKFYDDVAEKKLIATKEFKTDGTVYTIFTTVKRKCLKEYI